MKIHFTKMHGCGNDFVMIDHRDGRLNDIDLECFIIRVCQRKYGIGANGIMLLEQSEQADFKMRYFNADGSVAEICGNGARCMAKFAYMSGAAEKEMTFETLYGNYEATVLEDGMVSVDFPDIEQFALQMAKQLIIDREEIIYYHGTVGVPHTVVFGEKVCETDAETFENWGRTVRHQAVFPEGTNVNYVEVTGSQTITIRTYERGVEEETLACGSGVCAAAIFTALLGKGTPPFDVLTMGGILRVDFTDRESDIANLSLTGNAVFVYEGVLTR